jgi:hypothetical protein
MPKLERRGVLFYELDMPSAILGYRVEARLRMSVRLSQHYRPGLQEALKPETAVLPSEPRLLEPPEW